MNNKRRRPRNEIDFCQEGVADLQPGQMGREAEIIPIEQFTLTDKLRLYHKQIIMAVGVLIALLVAYSYLKPPGLSTLRYYLETGKRDQQIYAIKQLEKYGRENSDVLPVLAVALHSKLLSIRNRAMGLLRKFKRDAVPELILVLESRMPNNVPAKIAALALLRELSAQEAKRQIYDICISSNSPDELRQAAIDTLVQLFPDYGRHYHLQDGRWYTNSEMRKKGYIKIDTSWRSFESLVQDAEACLAKAQHERQSLHKQLAGYHTKLPIADEWDQARTILRPWEIAAGKCGQAISALKSLKHISSNSKITDKIREFEAKVAQEVEALAEQLNQLGALLQQKEYLVFTLLAYEQALEICQQALAWQWTPKCPGRKLLQDYIWQQQQRIEALRERSPLPVLIDSIETKTTDNTAILQNIKNGMRRALWSSQQLLWFTRDASSLQRKFPSCWLMCRYKEMHWRHYQIKAKSVEEMGQDVILPKVILHVSYWKQENEKWLWEDVVTALSKAPDSANRESDLQALQQRLLAETCQQLWQKLKKWRIPWDKIEKLSAASQEEEKVSGSTLYRQTACDKIYLKDGRVLEGLIEKEDDTAISLLHFWQSSGGQQMIASHSLKRNKIKKMERIPDHIREFRLDTIKNQKMRKAKTRKSIAAIPLTSIRWEFPGGGSGWKYSDKRFEFYANTSDDFTKEIIFRTMQIFQGYERFFHVERNMQGKIKIYLFNSMREYYQATGGEIMNPAFYMPAKNYIVAGCDLHLYTRAVNEVKGHHSKVREQLAAQGQKIRQIREKIVKEKRRVHKKLDDAMRNGSIDRHRYNNAYRHIRLWEEEQNRVLNHYRNIFRKLKDKLYFYDYQNKKMLDRFAGNMIATLYHESFHAFLQNFLFSQKQVKSVPLWLNEGLAQFFENSFMQGRTLLIGQMEARRRKLLQQYIRASKTIPIERFLQSDSREFIVQDIRNLENSTIHYLQSWALVYYLAQKYDLTKTNFFASYVKDLWRGTPATTAFQRLINKPLKQFDKEWKDALIKKE